MKNSFFKRYFIQSLITFILVIIIGYFLFQKKIETKITSSQIALTDSIGVNKILIKTSENDSILLQKSNFWKINATFEANQEAINMLFQAFMGLQISNIPKETKEQNSEAEIIFYKSDEIIKQITILNFDSTQNATLIHEKNTGKFVFVTVPGIVNDLTKRIVTDEFYWRTRTIIALAGNEIKSVQINYPNNEKDAFKLQNLGCFSLSDINGKLQQQNDQKCKQYFSYFTSVAFAKPLPNFSVFQKDSLMHQSPIFKLEIEDINSNFYLIKGYEKLQESNPKVIDKNNFIALVNNDKEVVEMKYYDIDLLLKTLKYFVKN